MTRFVTKKQFPRRAFRGLIIVASFCISIAPLQAARECEDPNYLPQPVAPPPPVGLNPGQAKKVIQVVAAGHCAHLPTAEIFYRDTGPSKNGNGEAVIFMHAGTGNADAFENQFEAFANAGYRVISYDRKNVGKSSNTLRDVALGRSMGTTVEDLDNLATLLLGANAKFHLVGLAAGAQQALGYAAWRQERLLSMVLAATLGTTGTVPEIAQFTTNITMPFEVHCPTPAGAATSPIVKQEHRELGASFRGGNRPGVDFYAHIEENSRHRTVSANGCVITNTGANQAGVAGINPLLSPDTYAKLQQIHIRTLVMAGGGDILSPPFGMRLWGVHLGDAQWTMVTDAGHAVEIEAPDVFNERVLRFLKGGYPFERISQ